MSRLRGGWPGVRGKSLARGYGPGSGKGVGARVWQGIGADKVSGASTPPPYGLQKNNVKNVNILCYLTYYEWISFVLAMK